MSRWNKRWDYFVPHFCWILIFSRWTRVLREHVWTLLSVVERQSRLVYYPYLHVYLVVMPLVAHFKHPSNSLVQTLSVLLQTIRRVRCIFVPSFALAKLPAARLRFFVSPMLASEHQRLEPFMRGVVLTYSSMNFLQSRSCPLDTSS